MFILLALLHVPAFAIELEADPRLDCAHRLEIARPVIDLLVRTNEVDELEAEHTAVVPGLHVTRVPNGKPTSEDVVVIVRPDGVAVVCGFGEKGGLIVRPPRPSCFVRVPDFRNHLRANKAGRWYWRSPTVASLSLGDVPKGEFMDRAEAAVRELMRLNVLTLDGMRFGHVYRGTYRGVAYDVLMHPILSDETSGVVVFDANTGALASPTPSVAARQYILLQSGERVGLRDDRWVTLPAIGWMHDPEEVGSRPSLRAFVLSHPTALDDLLFRDVWLTNIDFTTSEVRPATDEVSGEEFLLLTASSGDGETTHYFLYDPRAEVWRAEDSLGTRTFRLPGWDRLGVNLPEPEFRPLPPADEFERTRALFR